jgi:ubiquinone/menaquinone biosynthesis C-methylase UbiE
MKNISHQRQQTIWNKEHKNPLVLLPMHSITPSSGVVLFFQWLKAKNKIKNLTGLEMGCGKGRNSIWLAKQGVNMTGFDFSKVAIKEAKNRAKILQIKNEMKFLVQDATTKWPFRNNQFDFAIDCFASTDIETSQGRDFARKEFWRVLRPKGVLFLYLLSTEDQFHRQMIQTSPTNEPNAFLHPNTGKYEKVFSQNEIKKLYKDWKLIKQKRIVKTANFYGKKYLCKHFWIILQNTK